MRVKAVLAYDGGFFHGFQRQTKTKKTITGSLEAALSALQIESRITGSGRTDAGVHASGQVIHFDLPEYWSDTSRLQHELNRRLKHIRLKHITPVDESFHARFSARRRIYRYLFKRSLPSLYEERYVAHYPSFDPDRIDTLLARFTGRHDFIHFYKTGSDIHTTVREIYRTRYRQIGHYHLIYFEANGFLRSQVRMMTEALMQTASDRLTEQMLQEQIDGEKRHISSLAPASGLYLARILY